MGRDLRLFLSPPFSRYIRSPGLPLFPRRRRFAPGCGSPRCAPTFGRAARRPFPFGFARGPSRGSPTRSTPPVSRKPPGFFPPPGPPAAVPGEPGPLLPPLPLRFTARAGQTPGGVGGPPSPGSRAGGRAPGAKGGPAGPRRGGWGPPRSPPRFSGPWTQG